MKKAIMVAMLLYAGSVVAQPVAEAASIANNDVFTRNSAVIGKQFPEFSMVSGSKVLNNSHIKGKVVFINFWFSACPPCIAEIEELNNLKAKFSNNDSFMFISVNYEDLNELQEQMARHRIKYDVYIMPRKDAKKLINNAGYPTNIVIDANGEVVYFHTGGSTNKQKVSEYYNSDIYPLLNKLLQK